SRASSLRLDVCRLNDRPPLLNLGPVKDSQRLWALLLAREQFLSQISKPLLHCRIGQCFENSGVQPRNDVLRSVLGCPDCMPDRDMEPDNPASAAVGISGAADERRSEAIA